jgi:predicted dinucleotide-binding enzyme
MPYFYYIKYNNMEIANQTIGIIGSGNIAQAFAGHVAKAGYTVTISNSRGIDSLAALVQQLGHNAKAGTIQEAAQADLVLIAVPFDKIPEAVAALPDWNGRIVIDPSNAIVFPEFKPADLGGKTSSEIIAQHLPGARVVKAFNTLDAAILAADPRVAGGNRVLFLSGDDKAAKADVKQLMTSIGFTGIDLGKLVEGGRMQEFGGPLPTINLIRLPMK